MQSPASASLDKRHIKEHIQHLYEAFLRKDRAAIRAGHTADWTGFQIRSTRLVRGIEQYMANAEEVLDSIEGLRYEFVDFDIQLHGDIAIVFYLTREWIKGDNGREKTILVRAVDLYRREPPGSPSPWNQFGSNICVLPDEGR